MRHALVLFLLVSAGCGPFTTSSPPQAARQALAGVWVLHASTSDDPEAAFDVDPGDAPRPPGDLGPIRVRIGPGLPAASGGFGRPRGFDPELARRAVELVRYPHQRLTVLVDQDTVLLTADGGAPYLLIADGRTSERPWIDGVPAKVEAEWKRGSLRVERRLENALRVTESYTVDTRNDVLVVETEVEGPIPRKIEIRRVYLRGR